MDDKKLRQYVLDELDYEPSIEAAHIAVAVNDGVVTLAGHVRSYEEKVTVERAILRLRGVKAIAGELDVRYANDRKSNDDEIAERAVKTIAWHAQAPGTIKVQVEHGLVHLTGCVDWQYQSLAAEAAVQKLTGVIGVVNCVAIKPRVKSADVKKLIEDALKRNAELESSAIRVSVVDNKVTLEGEVSAWSERAAAERAAWSAPGVSSVTDRLQVQ